MRPSLKVGPSVILKTGDPRATTADRTRNFLNAIVSIIELTRNSRNYVHVFVLIGGADEYNIAFRVNIDFVDLRIEDGVLGGVHRIVDGADGAGVVFVSFVMSFLG